MESWLKPMLCGSADAVPSEGDWQIEPKLDGWRYVTWNTGRGVLSYGGRDGSDYSRKVPQLDDFMRLLPVDSALDGELIDPARGWNGVQSAMTDSHMVGNELVYVAFDVLRLGGIDARAQPLRERRLLLQEIMEKYLPNEWVTYTPIINEMPDPLQWALDSGFEGVVCKQDFSPYQSGMRSPFWRKVKPQSTDEAIVVGFKPGKGSFEGLIGAIEFEMCDAPNVRSRCSGMDMRTRKHMTEHPDEWIGKIIEIKHHGRGESGKPRHPQFHRRRDDRTVRT